VLYGLYLVCFQQVYAQLPAVYLQHPFWGDVSSLQPLRSSVLNKTQDAICLEPQQPDSGAFGT